MTEEVLLAWLLREPQTLVWWTTLYRLTAAELGQCYQILSLLQLFLIQDCCCVDLYILKLATFHPLVLSHNSAYLYCIMITVLNW